MPRTVIRGGFAAAVALAAAGLAPSAQAYQMGDIAWHNRPDDCWMVVDGDVFVLTDYLNEHRGEPENLEQWCGKDATDAFAGRKARRAARAILDYRIGSLDE